MRIRQLALQLIRAYQRWVSPHKGFVCAHRLHRGGAGCSGVGFRLIRRHGLWDGLPLLRERLRRCGDIARAASRRPLAAQRGDCDCDLPGLDCDSGSGGRRALACGCDAATEACGCDWPRRKQDAPRSKKGRHSAS